MHKYLISVIYRQVNKAIVLDKRRSTFSGNASAFFFYSKSTLPRVQIANLYKDSTFFMQWALFAWALQFPDHMQSSFVFSLPAFYNYYKFASCIFLR